MADSLIFKGIQEGQIPNVLRCLQASFLIFEADQIILYEEERLSGFFLILKGTVELANYDWDGRKSIRNIVGLGGYFGENAGSVRHHLSHVQARALQKVKLLRLEIERIFASDSCRCPYKMMVMENLLRLLCDSNDFLMLKTELFRQKNLRGKLMLYLDHLAKIQNSATVSLPFNRTELADFLAAGRSALSREISRMQLEQLISVQKNRVRIMYRSVV